MNKREKLQQLKLAAVLLETAQQALEAIANDSSDAYYLVPDARSLVREIQTIRSTDHDQAGLEPLIRLLSQSVEA